MTIYQKQIIWEINMISTQKIIQYYKQLLQYAQIIQQQNITKLIQDFDQQLLMAPNSIYDNYGGCYQGGWVQHCVTSLRLSDKQYRVLYQTIEQQCQGSKIENIITFNKKSVYKTIILSNLGKIGQPGVDSYIRKAKKSTYGRNTQYDYNIQLPRLKYQDRSILLANRYSIQLTQEQLRALLCASRLTSQQKSSYIIDYLDIQHISETLLPTLVAICNLNAFKILKLKQTF